MEDKNKKYFSLNEFVGESFGERLRNIRKNRGLNQSDFAKDLGFKASGSISNIENNITPPNIQTLTKMAEILNIDLHWLITGRLAPDHLEALKNLLFYLNNESARLYDKMAELNNKFFSIPKANRKTPECLTLEAEIKRLNKQLLYLAEETLNVHGQIWDDETPKNP